MTRAEKAALEAYPPKFTTPKRRAKRIQSEKVDTHAPVRAIFRKAYEQGQKETIERAVAWLEETFFDNSHHSGRGSYGQIETNDFDSMEEMIVKFKKTMEEEK